MFLLDHVSAPDVALVKAYLTNKDLFESANCRYEYALLVKHKVRELDPGSFDTILSWVAEPPALEVFRENARVWGRETSEEDALCVNVFGSATGSRGLVMPFRLSGNNGTTNLYLNCASLSIRVL